MIKYRPSIFSMNWSQLSIILNYDWGVWKKSKEWSGMLNCKQIILKDFQEENNFLNEFAIYLEYQLANAVHLHKGQIWRKKCLREGIYLKYLKMGVLTM